jgi:eukaryotic-like serine/threonine-protein kinase
MELAEGLILDGGYRLQRRLGRGSVGEVWEAAHAQLPGLVALKILLDAPDPEQLAHYQRDSVLASRLGHPHIAQVEQFTRLPDGGALIVMERLAGEDLRARLSRGPVTLAEVREIARQLVSALQLAHDKGLVHGNLKPENIFLCREPHGGPQCKLLDFGSAHLQAQGEERVPGVPGYLAPEQVMGRCESFDGRVDVFALAAIVHEMLTGQCVFMGDTLGELAAMVLYHQPLALDALLPGVPLPISLAVARGLSKDADARQGDIREFGEALLSAPGSRTADRRASERPAPAYGAPPIDATDATTRSEYPQPATPSQPARRRRARAIALAVAGIALAVGAGAWWQVQGERPRARPVEPLPVDAAREPLDAAERALDQGQPADALRLARGANSERAYYLMARAYCGQRDVEMVLAMLRNLSPALRVQVRAACLHNGLKLP